MAILIFNLEIFIFLLMHLQIFINDLCCDKFVIYSMQPHSIDGFFFYSMKSHIESHTWHAKPTCALRHIFISTMAKNKNPIS